MGRPKGAKNKPKIETIQVPDEIVAAIGTQECGFHNYNNEDKMPELNQFALSVIDNLDGTKTVLKIPFDYKTKTFGTPEVVETSDSSNALYRFRVVAGDLFG